MNVVPGSSIGPYSVVREIGRGGMGVVYLARDPRLDRDVAIKALPEHVAGNPDRLVRFESEARTLAQLNHPGVAGILGVEEVDGNRYLILEYVDGEALADRLEAGPLPYEDALELCIKIAAGVEAAHDAGVIHRDLKPDNVKITPAGDVKVLDFGLAKMAEGSGIATSAPSDPALSHSPTMTSLQPGNPTLPGMVLGTAAYMSPEQARGRTVDKRTDIWSFGVVLYECLTGASPFVGETAGDSIGAILHKPADLERLPPGTPRMVHHVLARCLERDKSQRYRDIGDVRIELERALARGTDDPDAVTPSARRGLALLPAAGVAVAVALLAALAAWFAKPDTASKPLPVLHAELALPAGQRFAHEFYPGLAISPDGQVLAFFSGDDDGSASIGAERIMLRHLDQPGATPLAGAAVRGAEPAFSPDGTALAYAATGGLFTLPLTGGQPTKLCDTSGTIGLSWGEDGSIAAGHGTGLLRVPATGGSVETITQIDGSARELDHRLPHFLPGGRTLLFTVLRFGYQLTAPGAWSVWALRLDTGERTLVIEHASDARYVNGHIVFAREGALYAAPFDLERLELVGDPRVVLENVLHSIYTPRTGIETGAAQFAISASGTLVYAEGSVFPEAQYSVVSVDREGNETLLDVEPRQYHNLRGSPDGRSLLTSVFYSRTSGVWVHDLERGLSRRQRSEGTGLFAAWGPGPDQITYDRTDDDGSFGVFVKPLGGGRRDETAIELLDTPTIWIGDWSRDGKHLLGVSVGEGSRIWSYTPGESWKRVTSADTLEAWPALSPDGRWLAHGSAESGNSVEVLVRPFPGPGASVQVSLSGGRSPVWSPDGRELFFRGRDAEGQQFVMATPVSTAGGRIDVGVPVKLFEDAYGSTGPIRSWDVLADGRFVLSKQKDPAAASEQRRALFPDRIRIVQNWASTLD